jgi:hypothetical protein
MDAVNAGAEVEGGSPLAKINLKPEQIKYVGIERLRKIATNFKATVIIQHDARDIDKLPVFPESAN